MNLSINPNKLFPSFAGRSVMSSGVGAQNPLKKSKGVDTFELTSKPEPDKNQMLKSKIEASLSMEDYDGILNACGIEVKQNEQGEKILTSFHQPSQKYSFADLGVDENKLLQDVVGVDGDFDIADSTVSSLPNLKYVRGSVDMAMKNDVSMPNLQSVGRSVRAPYTSNIDMSSLSVINGHANFEGATDVDLSSLVKIADSATFVDAENVMLSNLLYTGDDLDISLSSGIETPKLTDVGGSLIAREADIEDLSSVKFIKGSVDVSDSKVAKLATGIMVDGDIHAENSKLTAIRIGSVGGSVFIKGTNMEMTDFFQQNICGHVEIE